MKVRSLLSLFLNLFQKVKENTAACTPGNGPQEFLFRDRFNIIDRHGFFSLGNCNRFRLSRGGSKIRLMRVRSELHNVFLPTRWTVNRFFSLSLRPRC